MDNLVLIGGALGLAGIFALMHRGEKKDVMDFDKRKTEKVQPFKKVSKLFQIANQKIISQLPTGYKTKVIWENNKPYWEYYPKEGSGIIWYAVYDKKAGIPKLWMGYNPKNLLNQIRYY